MNIISFLGGISPDDSTFIGVVLIVGAIMVLFAIYMYILEMGSSKKRIAILCSVFCILVIFGVAIPLISLSCNCADENVEEKTIIIKGKFTETNKYCFYDTFDNKYLMHGDEVAFRYEKIELNTTYMIRLNAIAGNLSCHERERNK